MAHRLTSGAAPNCSIPHGHDEVVTVKIASDWNAPLDEKTNMLAEFGSVKGRWFEWIDNAVDHSFQLAGTDPLIAYFRESEPEQIARLLITPGDPTTEIRAACYHHKLTAFLESGGHNLVCTQLTIDETPTNAVTYAGRGANLPTGDHWWNRDDLTINDF